jgi:hypothetical protein
MYGWVWKRGLLQSSSHSEKTLLINEWVKCFERIGDRDLRTFCQVLNFLCKGNLLYHLHTASQSLVQILSGESGGLPVGLGMSAVIDESSAVCNDSDEFIQFGEFLRDIF